MDSIKNFDVISEDELSMVEGGGLGKAIIGGAVAGAWGGLVTGGPAGAFVGAHVGAAGELLDGRLTIKIDKSLGLLIIGHILP